VTRRSLLAAPAWLATALGQHHAPLKLGHRAASMKMVGDFNICQVARQIPGLMGVELQIAAGEPNLWDLDAVRRYKREAYNSGIQIPSLSGVWGKDVSIKSSPVAGVQLLKAIRAAELIGSSAILVAFFRDRCPNMGDESSYGPVVQLLKAAAPRARDAGVVLGLENSLSPADNVKLVDLVAEPNVKVYYDVHNMAFYGHGAEALPGIKLLGKDRICQVHVKNEERLIEDDGSIDWRAAFDAFKAIGYEGWYVFESRHSSRQQLISSTTRNIEFVREQLSGG